LLLTGATTSLLLLLEWAGSEFRWLSLDTIGLGILTVALAALFIRRETTAPEPLIRLELFRNQIFARGVAISGMMAFAMLGSTVFLPLYFQLVFEMGPAKAGMMLMPQVAGMLISSVLGGRVVTRLGRNKPFLLAGIGLEAGALASLAAFAWLAASPEVFVLSMAALGVGMGMGMPNLTTAVQNAVPHAVLGAATGAMSFMRPLGDAVGVAASGTIMAAGLAAALAGGGLDLAALNAHGLQALARFTPLEQATVGAAYRTALTGSFLLSGVVMTAAFFLVLDLPEIMLRTDIETVPAKS
jgi:predicted MFS family arabinose efflux permease